MGDNYEAFSMSKQQAKKAQAPASSNTGTPARKPDDYLVMSVMAKDDKPASPEKEKSQKGSVRSVKAEEEKNREKSSRSPSPPPPTAPEPPPTQTCSTKLKIIIAIVVICALLVIGATVALVIVFLPSTTASPTEMSKPARMRRDITDTTAVLKMQQTKMRFINSMPKLMILTVVLFGTACTFLLVCVLRRNRPESVTQAVEESSEKILPEP